MPSLQEVYELDVKLHGEDSKSAKDLKRQMEVEKANKGRSLQELFETEFGPKLHELNND